MNRYFDGIDIIFMILIILYLLALAGCIIYILYKNGFFSNQKIKLKVTKVIHKKYKVVDIIHPKKKKSTKKRKTANITKKTTKKSPKKKTKTSNQKKEK